MALYTPKQNTKFSNWLCKRFENQTFEYALPFIATIVYKLHYNRCDNRSEGDILFSSKDYLEDLANVKDELYGAYYNIMIRVERWRNR